MNYKVEKYRDLMEEDKRRTRNYAIAAACFLGISVSSLMHTPDEASLLYLEALLRLPVAASILTAGAGLICLNKANSIKDRTKCLTK